MVLDQLIQHSSGVLVTYISLQGVNYNTVGLLNILTNTGSTSTTAHYHSVSAVHADGLSVAGARDSLLTGDLICILPGWQGGSCMLRLWPMWSCCEIFHAWYPHQDATHPGALKASGAVDCPGQQATQQQGGE
jgi:hypothetical protein